MSTWQSPHSPLRQSNIMSAPAAVSASRIVVWVPTVASMSSRGIRTTNSSGSNQPLLPKVSYRRL